MWRETVTLVSAIADTTASAPALLSAPYRLTISLQKFTSEAAARCGTPIANELLTVSMPGYVRAMKARPLCRT